VFSFFLLFVILFTKSAFAQTTTPVATSSANILINEYMADATPEWVELVNNNNFSVSIANWKLGDSTTNTKPIPSTTIPPNGYFTFDIAGFFLNNNSDSVKIIDSSDTLIDSTSYTSTSPTYSWTKNTSWCLAIQSKGSSNNSCYVTPTPIPTSTSVPTSTSAPTATLIPSNTSTPTPSNSPTTTKYPTSTPLPTLEIFPTLPPEPTAVIEPTVYLPDAPTISDPQVLGDMIFPTPTKTPSKFTTSPTTIAIIFIILGGILLLIPILLIKFNR
jgi:hypothetical protein